MENKSLGRPSTTKCTKRDNPPCPDGGQGGGMAEMLASDADFMRGLSLVLECNFQHDSRARYRESVLRIARAMHERAERIYALLEKAKGEEK